MTGDPVSWFLIEPGWRVVAADGTEVGRVDEVAGDSDLDIFDGLAVAAGLIAKPRYVPSELVAEISEGEIHLSIAKDEFDRLGEYAEPATSLQIEGDNKPESGLAADAREVLGKVVAPIQKHEGPMTIWRRLWLAVRRPFG
jgi:hypothetical protein